MQIVRVVIVRVIVDGVHGVTIVVLIGHDEVLVIYVAIFVVIFCNWRCTLYTKQPTTLARFDPTEAQQRIKVSVSGGERTGRVE